MVRNVKRSPKVVGYSPKNTHFVKYSINEWSIDDWKLSKKYQKMVKNSKIQSVWFMNVRPRSIFMAATFCFFVVQNSARWRRNFHGGSQFSKWQNGAKFWTQSFARKSLKIPVYQLLERAKCQMERKFTETTAKYLSRSYHVELKLTWILSNYFWFWQINGLFLQFLQ